MATLELLIKPLKFQDAIKRLGKKKPVARKLSSKQWAAMPTQIRERAYFTANVESMKFLNRSKKMIKDYLAGAREMVTTPDGRRVSALKKTGRADFVYEMQKLAKQTGMGNILPPGEDMSRDMIARTKDIASETRLNLIFDTQTQQAQSYGYYKQGQDPSILDAYPAQRFIRAEQRKVPRPLHKQNRNEVRRKDDMEFWLKMNDQSIGGFGVPFGPWGFNSGMDVEDVRRDKAIQMGLIAKNEQVLPPDDTFNKGLKASADVEPEFLKKFLDKMGMDAYTNGEFVEIIEKISNAPAPAPAKKVVFQDFPQVEEMVIEGLPEPEGIRVPMPEQWIKKQHAKEIKGTLKTYAYSLNRQLKTLNPSSPAWLKRQAKIFDPKGAKQKLKDGKLMKEITEGQIREELNKRTKKWTENSHSFVRVRKGTFQKILKDGRFKTQFETKTSGGSMNNEARAVFEKRAFRYPENLNPIDRPVYGYAVQSNKGIYTDRSGKETQLNTPGLDRVAQYGKIRIRLKDKTRNRTTVTFDDSLGSYSGMLPTPLQDATLDGQPLHTGPAYVSDIMERLEKGNPVGRYVETQVHGGVSLDDISYVYFPHNMKGFMSTELLELLKEKGIRWTVD